MSRVPGFDRYKRYLALSLRCFHDRSAEVQGLNTPVFITVPTARTAEVAD